VRLLRSVVDGYGSLTSAIQLGTLLVVAFIILVIGLNNMPWWAALLVALGALVGGLGLFVYVGRRAGIDEQASDLGTIRHSHVDWTGRRERHGAVTVGGPFCPRCKNALGQQSEGIPGGRVIAAETDMIDGPNRLHCWGCGEFYHFDYSATVGQVRDEARAIFGGGDQLSAPVPTVSLIPISFPAYSSENGIGVDRAEYFVSRPVHMSASDIATLSAELEIRLRHGVGSGVIRVPPLVALPPGRGGDEKAELFQNGMTIEPGIVHSVTFAFRIEPEDVATLQDAVGANERSNTYRGHGVYLHLTDTVSGNEAFIAFGSGYPRPLLTRQHEATVPIHS